MNSRTPILDSRSGFSLVEVLCAIMILSVGLVGLTQGITTALRASKESEWQTAAALLAAGQIETLRAGGYLEEGDDEGVCESIPAYRWKQSVTRADLDGLYEITVQIERVETEKEVFELRALLFDPPYDFSNSTETAGESGGADSARRSERNRSRRRE